MAAAGLLGPESPDLVLFPFIAFVVTFCNELRFGEPFTYALIQLWSRLTHR